MGFSHKISFHWVTVGGQTCRDALLSQKNKKETGDFPKTAVFLFSPQISSTWLVNAVKQSKFQLFGGVEARNSNLKAVS